MPQGHHENSKKSYRLLDKATRQAQIYRMFKKRPESYTDRQVLFWLNLDDMNQVRPRITELIRDGYLYEGKSVICSVTGRPVRTVKAYARRKKL